MRPLRFAVAIALASASASSSLPSPPLASGPWGARNPVAPTASTVVSGHARFTVLTPCLIRVEWSNEAKFENRATVAVINRYLPTPAFTTSTTDGILTVDTASVRLQYHVGAEFSPTSLTVTSLNDSSAFDAWHFSQADTGNLLGTIRTLDGEDLPPLNCTLVNSELQNQCGWDESDCQCEWGLVSRDGWAVVDDADNWGLDAATDW